MKFTQEDFWNTMQTLGWDTNDDIVIEIGGTVVSGIHQGEEYNKKWATPFGVRKYNKDAFIVIKNLSRTPFAPSVNDDPERLAHHSKVEASNKAIAENLLTSIAELVDGRWYRTETLDYTGKRTRRYIIESDITEEPDSSESDVSGSDSSDT